MGYQVCVCITYDALDGKLLLHCFYCLRLLSTYLPPIMVSTPLSTMLLALYYSNTALYPPNHSLVDIPHSLTSSYLYFNNADPYLSSLLIKLLPTSSYSNSSYISPILDGRGYPLIPNYIHLTPVFFFFFSLVSRRHVLPTAPQTAPL